MPNFLKQIMEIPGFRHPLRWVAVYSVAINLLAFAPILHTTQIFDRILSSRSISSLIYLSLIVVICVAVMSFAEGLRQIIGMRLSNVYAAKVSEPLFIELASGRHGRADQAMLLRDLTTVRNFLSSRISMSIFDVPFAVIFILAMFVLNIWLGLVTLLGAGILVGLAVNNKQATAESQANSAKGTSDAISFAQVALQRSEDMRAMGLIPNVLARWGRTQVRAINDGDRSGLEQAIHHSISRFVRQVLQVIIMAFGAYLVIHGDMSGGMIFAASILSGKALQPIEQMIGSWDGLMQASAAEQRISAVMKTIDSEKVQTRLPDPVGRITLENVEYRPEGQEEGPPILSGITATFNPGSIVVILGPSGAGKSTLARLLVSAIKPSSGSIRLDGFELDQWDETRRGKALGYVPQDIALFPGSVAENIARLDPVPDSEAVIRAAMMAGVHDLIARFPHGYDTMLGPGFHDISGGQRQRIALARAFYGNPKVLVLDEPNAHLDAQGEELLMRALAAARAQQITTILISQRQSILQVADFVVVIQEGKIANMGPVRRQEANMGEGAAQPAPAPAAPGKPATASRSDAMAEPAAPASIELARPEPAAKDEAKKTDVKTEAKSDSKSDSKSETKAVARAETKTGAATPPTVSAPSVTPTQTQQTMSEPLKTESSPTKKSKPSVDSTESTSEPVKERTIVMRAGRPDDIITAINKKAAADKPATRSRPVMLPKGPPGPDTPQEPRP